MCTKQHPCYSRQSVHDGSHHGHIVAHLSIFVFMHLFSCSTLTVLLYLALSGKKPKTWQLHQFYLQFHCDLTINLSRAIRSPCPGLLSVKRVRPLFTSTPAHSAQYDVPQVLDNSAPRRALPMSCRAWILVAPHWGSEGYASSMCPQIWAWVILFLCHACMYFLRIFQLLSGIFVIHAACWFI